MTAPLAEVVLWGNETVRAAKLARERDTADRRTRVFQMEQFFIEHGPRLLAVAKAVPPLLAYLEEEVLEAKTCEGQDEQTGKPCEWHAILLALDAAARGEKP